MEEGDSQHFTGDDELVLPVTYCRQLNQLCRWPTSDWKVSSLEEVVSKLLSEHPNCKVGPRTFFPKQDQYYSGSSVHELRESPFIGAAKYGNLQALEFFLMRFGEIDVNASATCTFDAKSGSFQTLEVLHKCTALLAACHSGAISTPVVKLLVSHGASVNIPNCQKSTPLMGAAAQGSLDVVKYLIDHGASVNAVNLVEDTPLGFAAEKGHSDVITFLLKAGADPAHHNVHGETAMHLAAREGHCTVVQELLNHCGCQTLHPHTPSPILFAASEGHRAVVDLLVSDGSPELQTDALLLLGASIFEKNQAKVDEEVESLWTKALMIRVACFREQSVLHLSEIYASRVEMQTLDDFLEIKDLPVELIYQCLIMRERIIGNSKRLIVSFNRTLNLLERMKKTTDCQMVWSCQLDLAIALLADKPSVIVAHYFSHVFYSMWLQNLHYFDNLLYNIGTGQLPPEYKFHFYPIATFAIKGLQFLELPSPEPECIKPECLNLVVATLGIFSLWLKQTFLAGVPFDVRKRDSDAPESFDSDCEMLGRSFVSKYLYLPNSTTLLHTALHEDHVWEFQSVPLLISALLRWGADSVINDPDSQGARPLHLAVKHAGPDTVIHLVDGGAHLDAVDGDGNTPAALYNMQAMEYCEPSEQLRNIFLSSPLPLYCLCCHRVIAEGFPYERMDLPPHVKKFVRLHNSKFI